MNNFVSFNAKYYKHSNSSGEIGHVQRAFAENKNAYKELAYMNFSSSENILKVYQREFRSAAIKHSYLRRKKANTFLDGVVSFSRDKVDYLIEKHGYEKFKELMVRRLNDYGKTIEREKGFKFIGWSFHGDEGHKCPKTGEFKHNWHAQMIFLNYDAQLRKMPLRKMLRKDWSAIQDLAGQVFKGMGFKRGISKEETKAIHLEKDIFIKKKHEKEIEENRLLATFTRQFDMLLSYFEANNKKRIKSTEKRIQKTVNKMIDEGFTDGLKVVKSGIKRTQETTGKINIHFQPPRA